MSAIHVEVGGSAGAGDVTNIITATGAFIENEGKIDTARDYGRTLYDENGDLATTAIITPGVHTITRIRGGLETEIVGSTATSEALGRVYRNYNFPDADWDVGDVAYFTFTGIQVDGEPVGTTVVWVRIVPEFDSVTLLNDILDILTHVDYGNSALNADLDDIIALLNIVQTDTSTDLPNQITPIGVNVATSKAYLEHVEYGLAALRALILDLAQDSDIDVILVDLDNILDELAIIRERTDRLPDNPAGVGDQMALIDNAITSAKLHASAIAAIQAGLATAASIAALNNLSQAQAQAAALAALNTAVSIASPPTTDSVRDILHKDSGYTFDASTDSLEAIRDFITTVRGGSQTLESIYNRLAAPIVRSAQSGSTTLSSGTETTVYEEAPSAVWFFAGGFIDFSALTVATDKVTVKLYWKNASGAYKLVSSVEIVGGASITILPIPSSFSIGGSSTTTRALIKDGWNYYGVKVTLTRTGGSNSLAMPCEFFDSVG